MILEALGYGFGIVCCVSLVIGILLELKNFGSPDGSSPELLGLHSYEELKEKES